MYAERNYKTKRELKEAVTAWRAWFDNKDQWEAENPDKRPPPAVTYYQPGGMFPAQRDGTVYLEGPHYPKPHRWYAECQAENGRIVKVVR